MRSLGKKLRSAWNRPIDCTRLFGLPIQSFCILFAVINSCLSCYALWFLPEVPRIVLMTLEIVLMLCGCFTAIRPITLLTNLYLLLESLMIIPKCVVIGFTTLTIADFNIYHNNWRDVSDEYEQWLYRLDEGFLCSGLVVAIMSCFSAAFALVAFKRLKMYQQGAHLRSYSLDGINNLNHSVIPVFSIHPPDSILTSNDEKPKKVPEDPCETTEPRPQKQPVLEQVVEIS